MSQNALDSSVKSSANCTISSNKRITMSGLQFNFVRPQTKRQWSTYMTVTLTATTTSTNYSEWKARGSLKPYRIHCLETQWESILKAIESRHKNTFFRDRPLNTIQITQTKTATATPNSPEIISCFADTFPDGTLEWMELQIAPMSWENTNMWQIWNCLAKQPKLQTVIHGCHVMNVGYKERKWWCPCFISARLTLKTSSTATKVSAKQAKAVQKLGSAIEDIAKENVEDRAEFPDHGIESLVSLSNSINWIRNIQVCLGRLNWSEDIKRVATIVEKSGPALTDITTTRGYDAHESTQLLPLVSALKKNKYIQKLDLSLFDISKDDANLVLDLLKNHNSTLYFLYLSYWCLLNQSERENGIRKRQLIDFYLKLNKYGRKRNASLYFFLQTLIAAKDDTPVVYFYLSLNPQVLQLFS